MRYSPLLERLISALTCLPGVGKKGATRMAFQLLERNRQGGLDLSQALHDAMEHIRHCKECRTFTEEPICNICQNQVRKDTGLLCVVESPQDVVAIEQTGTFKGTYFVLMGHLSPIDGIGPDDLGLDLLEQKLAAGDLKEVILATNPTVEGEATAHYIYGICQQHGVVASRIAHGVPVGGELEFIDGNTLTHAFAGRKTL